MQSGGSPSITLAVTQAEKNAPYFAYLHPTWAKAMKQAVKPETVIIGSNYSVFRNGKNGLLAEDK